MIDEAKTQQFMTALRGGSNLDTALEFAGISKETYLTWLRRGLEEKDRLEAGQKPRPAEAPFVRWCEDISRAKVEAHVRNVAQVQKAANEGSWQAAAWWLERAFPDLYGRPANKNANFQPLEKPEAAPSMD